ncbi:transposase [Desulfarculales bacterium]
MDTDKQPHKIFLEVREPEYSCPECGRLCKAHDFHEFTWPHLNLFQHHCYVTARVPRVDCPDHGTKQAKRPWTREGSRFNLLFEQAAMTLVREMPVLAAARIIGVSDTQLWLVVQFYVAQAMSKMDLGGVKAVALDETTSKRGHNYVTVFTHLDRKQKPVIFVTSGKGKACLVLLRRFLRFLREHGGDHNNIAEVVCDRSLAFLAAIGESFSGANVTVAGFHVAQHFTTVRIAQWRITHLTRHALKYIAPDTKTLAPALKALMTLEEHAT